MTEILKNIIAMKTCVTMLFLMIATACVAAQESGDPAAVFARLDGNGDGSLSAEEARRVPALARVFSVIDADRDGLLSMEEVQTGFRRREDQPRRAAAPLDPNVSQAEHTLTFDGRERFFITQAPKNPIGKLPVVFVFHGGGGRGDGLAARGFGELVAKENILAVYPSGWRNNWNDGRNAARIISQQEGVDDVKFVRAIVDDLEKRHSIDRTRIFATGISNGGIFSHCLAAKAADLFAGVAPVVGGLAEPLAAGFNPSHPISLLVIQGDADPMVPIGGGPIAHNESGGRVIPTEDMLKLYLARNGVTGAPEIEKLPDTDPNDGTTTEVRRYPRGTDGVRVEYYLVKGGGHAMPSLGRGGLPEAIIGKTPRDFDGLKTIWEFFRACPPRIDHRKDGPANPRTDTSENKSRADSAFVNMRFTRDFQADIADSGMGGTEIVSLASHAGKLWAATSLWNDDTTRGNDDGCQILVKATAGGPWKLDFTLANTNRAFLRAVTFDKEHHGKRIDPPVALLLAGGTGAVHCRNDNNGVWVKMPLNTAARDLVRVLFSHVDRVTGIPSVYAVTVRSIFRGAYSAELGRVVWDDKPELTDLGNRVIAATDLEGVLYASVDRDSYHDIKGNIYDFKANGGIYHRVDGPQPTWVFDYVWDKVSAPYDNYKAWEQTRSLTATTDENGQTFLLGTRQVPGRIWRIDPRKAGVPPERLDLDLVPWLTERWGGLGSALENGEPMRDCDGQMLHNSLWSVVTIAYDHFTEATNPVTGEKVLLAGIWAQHPDYNGPLGKSSWYLVRHSDGRYELGRVFDPDFEPSSPGGLRATRAIIASPFPEERERVFYFAGFDASMVGSWKPHFHVVHKTYQDTAWIYRGEIQSSSAVTPPPVDGKPVLKSLSDCDAVRDAAGTGQLFECVHVPNLTDVHKGVNGFAIADLNRDGRPDVVATLSPPVSLPGGLGAETGSVQRTSRRQAIDQLAMLINEGGFRFHPHPVQIRRSTFTAERFGRFAQIPNLADFMLDLK